MCWTEITFICDRTILTLHKSEFGCKSSLGVSWMFRTFQPNPVTISDCRGLEYTYKESQKLLNSCSCFMVDGGNVTVAIYHCWCRICCCMLCCAVGMICQSRKQALVKHYVALLCQERFVHNMEGFSKISSR